MTTLVFYLLVFLGVGVFFLFFHLMLGKQIRPAKPDADKLTIYECGEPTIGSSWIQFDLRYYVVALLFVIFDVEVAFFFPWAVVFGTTNTLAMESTAADPAKQLQLTAELVPSFKKDGKYFQALKSPSRDADNRPVIAEPVNAPLEAVTPGVAKQFAWIAMIDIAIFFGVLLVGFAYLWKRGDIDWVRSTLAERQAEAPAKSGETRTLVGTTADSW
jgi:NADH-quinone oxidoreductase subunit A